MISIFHRISAAVVSRTRSDRGASLVEYALLVALIAVVCAVAVGFLGDAANESYSSTGSGLALN